MAERTSRAASVKTSEATGDPRIVIVAMARNRRNGPSRGTTMAVWNEYGDVQF